MRVGLNLTRFSTITCATASTTPQSDNPGCSIDLAGVKSLQDLGVIPTKARGVIPAKAGIKYSINIL